MTKVINLAKWQSKKQGNPNRLEDTALDARIERIKTSIERINNLMSELRSKAETDENPTLVAVKEKI